MIKKKGSRGIPKAKLSQEVKPVRRIEPTTEIANEEIRVGNQTLRLLIIPDKKEEFGA
jgi:hypothetical protein